MIDSLLAFAKTQIADVDYFLFHQPNRFMLQKLADKLKVPYQKMPMNVVEKFGNSSGVTIPVALTANLSESMISQNHTVCFAGFGVGLTWDSMLMKVGPLNYCRSITL